MHLQQKNCLDADGNDHCQTCCCVSATKHVLIGSDHAFETQRCGVYATVVSDMVAGTADDWDSVSNELLGKVECCGVVETRQFTRQSANEWINAQCGN